MALKNQIKVVGGTQAMGLKLSTDVQRARVPRYPKHTFNLVQYPYEITPFMIAPVLSGETMKNLLLQARCVSTALENRLIGHHLEHYFFYVKLRDLSDSDDLVTLLMDANTASAVNTHSGGDVYKYVGDGAPDYVTMCLDAVVEHYFRDEGDTASHVGSTTGLPMAQWTNYHSLIDSLIDDADMETGSETQDTPYPEYAKEYATWQFMMQNQMTELSFEDYLGTFGVRTPDAEIRRPELLRMVKNWTYPTNTVGEDGTVNTQASWSVSERADKDRFFKEPGFIFGVTVARPKLYLEHQDQSAVSMLNDALSWLPAMMKDDPFTSLKQIAGNSADLPYAATATPTAGQLDSDETYWFDMRDLFLYGDQFVNRTQGNAVNNAVRAEDLTDFHGKKYPQSAALQLIGVGDVLTYESDGIVSMNIMGTQIEAT